MKHWPQIKRLSGRDQTRDVQLLQVNGIRSRFMRTVIRWKQQRTTPDVSLRNRQLHHSFVVDHGELVMELVTAFQAWCSYTAQRNLKGLVVLFELAVSIR